MKDIAQKGPPLENKEPNMGEMMSQYQALMTPVSEIDENSSKYQTNQIRFNKNSKEVGSSNVNENSKVNESYKYDSSFVSSAGGINSSND